MKKIIFIVVLMLFSFIFITAQDIILNDEPKLELTKTEPTKEDMAVATREAELQVYIEEQNTLLKERYEDYEKFEVESITKRTQSDLKRELEKTSYCLDMVTIDGKVNFIPKADGKICISESIIDIRIASIG